MKTIIYILLLSLTAIGLTIAQEKWIVPDEDAAKISIQMFNEDHSIEGESIYEGSCQSCHGFPGEANFTLMSPSPGDLAAKEFQKQTDGAIFYKIKYGRNAMPGFGHLYSDNEIWTIVAFIRSFNKDYQQPKPDLTGVYVPDFDVQIGFDANVDKIEISVKDMGNPTDSAWVSAYLQGSFGLMSLGSVFTDNQGFANFNIDVLQPGDKDGFATIIVKVTKGYGYKKVVEKMQILTPKEHKNLLEERHLWSTDAMAPVWLKLSFFATIFGIWGVLIIIVIRLLKLRKLA